MTATHASPATEEYLQAVYTLADEGGQVISARLAEFRRPDCLPPRGVRWRGLCGPSW